VSVTPFHFGEPDAPLVGVLHPSAARSPVAVLVCPPHGAELVQAHRAVRTVAERLAADGWPTLRFDYSGSGDSAKDESTLDRRSMRDDAALALDELLDITGARRAVLVGVRLGAMPTADLANDPRVQRIVWWDAVTDGAALQSRWRRTGRQGAQGMLWVDGFACSPTLVEDVGAWRAEPSVQEMASQIVTSARWSQRGPDGWLHVPAPELSDVIATVERAAGAPAS
jgi:pimeloyl-ACP methyl ester carboxylesterase